MGPRRKTSITLYLEPDQHRALKHMSGITNIPMSEFIRIAITEFFLGNFVMREVDVPGIPDEYLKALWDKFIKNRDEKGQELLKGISEKT